MRAICFALVQPLMATRERGQRGVLVGHRNTSFQPQRTLCFTCCGLLYNSPRSSAVDLALQLETDGVWSWKVCANMTSSTVCS